MEQLTTFAAKASYYYNFDRDLEVFKAAAGLALGTIIAIIVLALIFTIYMIIVTWKIFEKAGEEGWKSLVPIYNIYTMVKIVKQPPIMTIGFLIPFVNIFFGLYLLYKLCHAFGQKDAGFIIGMIFFSPIFLSVLAFGKKYQYVLGDTAKSPTTETPEAPKAA